MNDVCVSLYSRVTCLKLMHVDNVMLFLDTSQGPLGVFGNNPAPGEFSATLWTLRYEVLAYTGAAILFFTGIARGWRMHLFLLVAATAGHLAVANYWPESPAIIALTLRLGAALSLNIIHCCLALHFFSCFLAFPKSPKRLAQC